MSKPTFDEVKTAIDELNNLPLMTQYFQDSPDHAKDKFCCPACGSGTSGERDSDGALHSYENDALPNLHCYSCGTHWHNAEIIKHREGLPIDRQLQGADFWQFAKVVYDELGRPFEGTADSISSQMKEKKPATPAKATAKTEEPHDYEKSGAYKIWQSNLPAFVESQGGAWRGLRLETLQRASAGFNNFNDGACVILPYDKNTYFRRSIGEPNLKMKNQNAVVQIYNPFKVLDSGDSVFVTEGEIDALSILQSGYQCVAIGGAGNFGKIIKQLETRYSGKGLIDKPKFIILLDNDDAGLRNAPQFQKALKDKEFLSVHLLLDDTRKVDANALLQESPDALKARLAELHSAAQLKFDEILTLIKADIEKARQEKFGLDANYFFKNQFWEQTQKARQFLNLQTGFRRLDRMQIWQAGVVTIGAPPSLGKTSFIWQLLEDIASECRQAHCIFVSYELSALRLYSKSVSREVARRETNNFRQELQEPLSSSQVAQGGFFVKDAVAFESQYISQMQAVIEDFGSRDIDLRVVDCSENRLNLDELIDKLEIIAGDIPAGELLILAIDYLQLIELGGKNPVQDKRLATDEVIHRLKDFSNKHNALIFCISSYNRSAYKSDADFSAFKESGALEYHSDVLWALQLYATDDNSSRTFEKTALDRAKQLKPRPMELYCLKNRFGGDYRLYFWYHSAVDSFIECTAKDFE